MKLYKFRSLQQIEFTLDILLAERLYCAPYKDLNDPFEGVFYTISQPPGMPTSRRIYKTIEDLAHYKSDVRICSLTQELSDIRMWSHYASGHQGVAIEIEFPDVTPGLFKVEYADGLQKFGTTFLGGATAREVLSLKTNHWEHEREYRIIQSDEYYDIHGKITGLFLGIRVSEVLKMLLVKAVSPQIPIFDTTLDKVNVKVKPHEQINAQQVG